MYVVIYVYIYLQYLNTYHIYVAQITSFNIITIKKLQQHLDQSWTPHLWYCEILFYLTLKVLNTQNQISEKPLICKNQICKNMIIYYFLYEYEHKVQPTVQPHL